MTTTVSVFVNGNYRATVKQDDREPVYVNPQETKQFYLPHQPPKGTHTVLEITEEFLGDKPKEA